MLHGMSTQILLPEWDLFLKLLAREPNVSKAARGAGLQPSACYARRARDAEFRREWDEAINEAVDVIEAELHRRAVDGVEKPVYFKGEVVGYVREFSDPLMALYVKRWRPEYRERSTVDMNAQIEQKPMTKDEKAAVFAELMAAAYAQMIEAQAKGDEGHDIG